MYVYLGWVTYSRSLFGILLSYHKPLAPYLQVTFHTCLLPSQDPVGSTTRQSLLNREKNHIKDIRYFSYQLSPLMWGFTSWQMCFRLRQPERIMLSAWEKGEKKTISRTVKSEKQDARSLCQCFLILHLALILDHSLFQQIFPNYNRPSILPDTTDNSETCAHIP